MGASKIPAWVYLLLVFLGGTGVGVFGDRLYTARVVKADTRGTQRGPDEFRKRYLEEMRSRLELSTTQVAEVNSVLEVTQQQMQRLHERDRPEMTAIHEEQVRRVRLLLNPQQKAEYDKMREERQKHRDQR